MPEEERGRLDSAIDRAVRGMMQIDPRPGLRHRVAGRLEAPARGGSWLAPALATAALCAVVFVSIVWLRSPQPQPEVVPQMAVAPQPAPTPRPDVARVLPAAPESRPAVNVRRRPAPSEAIFGPPQDRVAAASIAPDAPFADAPLESPAIPGGMPPLAPLTIEPIVLQPIAIAPVTVRALPGRK